MGFSILVRPDIHISVDTGLVKILPLLETLRAMLAYLTRLHKLRTTHAGNPTE